LSGNDRDAAAAFRALEQSREEIRRSGRAPATFVVPDSLAKPIGLPFSSRPEAICCEEPCPLLDRGWAKSPPDRQISSGNLVLLQTLS
jgi:hypothetical protein